MHLGAGMNRKKNAPLLKDSRTSRLRNNKDWRTYHRNVNANAHLMQALSR